MAKVKRIQPLEGETWDLSELGAVQHTSRWGTIARAKGSVLRYYPGCPWEKGPKCLPPPQWLWEVILAVRVQRSSNDVSTEWGVAIRGPNQLCFSTTSTGTWCRFGVIANTYQLKLVGYQEGWLLVEGELMHQCGQVPPYRRTWKAAFAVPGCRTGRPPSGYSIEGFRYCEPRDAWWGPRTGRAWIVDCGTLKSCYETDKDVPVILVQGG